MSRCIAAVFGTCVLLAAPSAAEDAKYVKFVHAESGKVLTVKDASTESEASVVVAKADGGESEQWQVVKDDKHLKIVNRKSGKALDVYGDSKDEGVKIIIWDVKDEGVDNQRWSWVGDEKEKTKRLKSKSSELVLDIGEDGEVVQKKADDKAKSQLWEVVEVK
jgi:hypothetical protein